jgi:hypothetical protein
VVLPKKATLLADGSVQITMKVRCNDQQQAFEWSVDIRQGTIFGNDSAGPVAGVITCNGQFHTVDALIPGANGPNTAGPANVQALVQLFDADEGSDVTRRPGSGPASTVTPQPPFSHPKWRSLRRGTGWMAGEAPKRPDMPPAALWTVADQLSDECRASPDGGHPTAPCVYRALCLGA